MTPPTYSDFWKGKRVLVTGGAGFIGSHVVDLLLEKGAHVSLTSITPHSENISHVADFIKVIQADLLNLKEAVNALKEQDCVFHLAAFKKNIEFHSKHPVDILSQNIQMTSHVFEAARINGVERMLLMSTGLVYGPDSQAPNKEIDWLRGDVEKAHYGYAWAKRVSEVIAHTYAQQYGMKIAIARPYNIFGPRDSFEPATAQIIPSFINRIVRRENPFTIWGNGEQRRSFLYVKDLARAVVDLTELYPQCDPVNIGTSEEILVKDLAALVMKKMGVEYPVAFDLEKPGGLPYRNCDVNKARESIGFLPEYDLSRGLDETIEWYRSHIAINSNDEND